MKKQIEQLTRQLLLWYVTNIKIYIINETIHWNNVKKRKKEIMIIMILNKY